MAKSRPAAKSAAQKKRSDENRKVKYQKLVVSKPNDPHVGIWNKNV